MIKRNDEPVLTIRPSKCREEVAHAFDWAIEEGWNISKYDAYAYYSTFPTGCQLLILNEKPIGAIFLANYATDLVFIGLFIMDKTYRGNGYGKKLWNHAMQQVQSNTSVGLYAVPSQVSRYKSSGFSTAYNVLRWQTLFSGHTSSSISPNDCVDPSLKKIKVSNAQIISDLERYESSLFPLPRIELIKAMLKSPHAVAFAVKESGHVIGYGLIRPCQEGYRIGPLYANDIETAKLLTTKLLQLAKEANAPVVLDTPSPETNRFINVFAEYFNLQRIEDADTEAMFKGEVPKVLEMAYEKNYAACSLELG